MPIRVVVLKVDMGAVRAFFFLHVPIQRSAVQHIQQLRSPAYPQDRNLSLQRLMQELNLDLVFQRKRLVNVFEVRLASSEPFRLYVISLHQQ